jgi:phosphatidylglycerol:prolipoprotein diacylglycerol transferase
MINFFHNNIPQSIFLNLGLVSIHWYGVFIVLAISSALFLTIFLAKKHKISVDLIIDLAFWLILGGIIGARFYELIIDFNYYGHNFLAIFKIWQGGLSIHGSLIVGIIVLYLFLKINAKKYKINFIDLFWKTLAIIVPGLALGQAIGRWGNYFNQELFGLPSSLPWAIPIDILHRPLNYISCNYFQPTFLYESIGNFLIFLILILIHIFIFKFKKLNKFISMKIVAIYLFIYSLLRFLLEFIRVDKTLILWNWRWPQIISIIIIIIAICLFVYSCHYENRSKKEKACN